MTHHILSYYKCEAYESLSLVPATATGFTSKYLTPQGEGANKTCREVFATLESAGMRFTIDGVTTPTTQVGHALATKDSLTLRHPGDILNFRAVAKAGTTASLKVSYRY